MCAFGGGARPTYRDVPPELCHVVVVAAEELGEPADGPLAALVHRFVALKVLVVFVDRVVGQVHVQLALRGQAEQSAASCLIVYRHDTSQHSTNPKAAGASFTSFHNKYSMLEKGSKTTLKAFRQNTKFKHAHPKYNLNHKVNP